MPSHNPVRPSGVKSSWKFDSTADYRTDGKRVNDFLRSLFQKDYKFFVKHVGDEYQFWVPRKLTEEEKVELDDEVRDKRDED